MLKVDLTGRVAIVTGAGQGLGRAYAIDLARYGAKVVVNDLGSSQDGSGFSDSSAGQVAEEIKASGGLAVANFDNVVTNADNIVKTALDTFGTVDILVNNAGVLRDKIFAKMDDESWDIVLNVHLKGTYSCIKAVWPTMRKKKYGRIVNITSGAGMLGNLGQANYAAAKSGIIGLSNVLKLEGARKNILTNVVAPIAASRMTEKIMTPEVFEKSKPELVAPLVTFLCSEQCLENGLIINAGLGYFSRSAILTGPGWTTDNAEITPDDIMSNLDKIKSLENPKYFNHIFEEMAEFLKEK